MHSKFKYVNDEADVCNLQFKYVNDRAVYLKGTISMISSDPSCRYDSVRFTMVP